MLRIPALAPTNPAAFGSLLFDMETDPGQQHPLVDADLELRLATMLVRAMRDSDAPPEQYTRLGLPETGEVTAEHLVLGTPMQQVAGLSTAATSSAALESLDGSVLATRTVRELLSDPVALDVLRAVLGPIVDGPLPAEALEMTVVDIATVTVGMVPLEAVQVLATELARAGVTATSGAE